MKAGSYHHGSLRSTLLEGAVAVISQSGPASLSLRDLARRAGVSYAAPTHHFGDKAGLLTALATQGFELLSAALEETRQLTGDFVEVGVSYVRFAIAHPAHFDVMFRYDLLHADDPALIAAQVRAQEALYAGLADVPSQQLGNDTRLAGVAAWSIVHGFATLHLNRALPAEFANDAELAARSVAGLLFAKDDSAK